MIETNLKIKDYIVIDIENPNTKADSICQIAMIQVKDDKVVYNKNSLINPEDRFDDINMRVHKITPNMVKDKVTFKEYWEEIKEIVTNNIVVGHGIKFDISVISKNLNKYGFYSLASVSSIHVVQTLSVQHCFIEFMCISVWSLYCSCHIACFCPVLCICVVRNEQRVTNICIFYVKKGCSLTPVAQKTYLCATKNLRHNSNY